MPKQNLKYLFILNIIIIPIFSRTCELSDFKQKFGECDLLTNKRNISIYISNNCTLDSSLENSNDPLLKEFSKLQIYTATCNKFCDGGYKLFYNPLTETTECKICPENTYSPGGNKRIIKNWSEEILKDFIINCYAINYEGYKLNEDCTGILLSNNNTMIESGDITGNQTKYFLHIIYPFSSQNSGRLLLKYKTDIENFQVFNKGEVKIYLDYNVINENPNNFINYEDNSNWKILYYDFNPGDHDLVIFFWFFKLTDEPIKLFIQNLELIGINDGLSECLPCVNSISQKGSERCYSCDYNYYFDTEKKECIQCPEGQYSLPNNNNKNECKEKQKCTEFDYEIKSISECVDGQKNIEFQPIQPIFCSNPEKLKSNEKVDCAKVKKDSDKKCQSGKVFTNEFNYEFDSYLIDEFFNENVGFKQNDKEIFTGLYNLNNNEKILTKNIEIISFGGLLTFSFSLNLNSDEIFKIKVNSKIIIFYSNFTSNNLLTESIKLPIGNVSISFIYENLSSSKKEKNSILISSLKIYGSNLGDSKKLLDCPIGFISKNNCEICEKCQFNEITNEDRTECIPCQNGNAKLINSTLVCTNCPSFTYYSEDKECYLNEFIFEKKNKIKFNLFPLKEYINILCEEQSGILCYDKSFIGPISLSNENINLNSNNNNIDRNIFFLSLFETKEIEITDFTFKTENNENKKGNIFGLFNSENNYSSADNNLFINTKVTIKNEKIKKNIAKGIKNVKIFGKSLNILERMGLFIEYENGDVCIKDSSRLYKAYLYLKCDKNELSSPKLIKIKDNECTYIFEWSSPYVCKNCIVGELKNYEKGACKNYKRKYIFEENEDCLIFNTTGNNYFGIDKEYEEDIVDDSSELYKIIFDKERSLKEENDTPKKKLNLGFDYIENKEYIEKCSFLENLDSNWKKYLLIAGIIYLLTMIGLIIYCVKYRNIKEKYIRLNNMSRMGGNGSNVTTDNVPKIDMVIN
jgi:hypothetical protein